MKRIDLVSMRLFVAVCETGEIAKGVERENLVASAVSKRLAELKQLFGLPLLERGIRGVKPTAAGEALLFQSRARPERNSHPILIRSAGYEKDWTTLAKHCATLLRLPHSSVHIFPGHHGWPSESNHKRSLIN